MKFPLYFDYAATTPVAPPVARAMMDCLTAQGTFANPASQLHSPGLEARKKVEEARLNVANLIHALPQEIIWTSGATESINLALKGAARMYGQHKRHIVTVKTEHKAVLDCCEALEKEGFSVTYLTPQANGLIGLDQMAAALRADTLLVSIMQVNNELGVIQDIAGIAALLADKQIFLHVDAAQSIGKLEIDVSADKIDLLSMCAHKVYGPKGIGALYIRQKPRIKLMPLIHGGGHEQGMRSGTLPTHQIVGMGEALKLAGTRMHADAQYITALREKFLSQLHVPYSINTQDAPTYPGILSIAFKNLTAFDFMQKFPELAITTGSACFASGIEPSYVLRALGLSSELLTGTLRFSFGRYQTLDEIDYATALINARLS